MHTHDETKKGMECCTIPLCDECPYDNDPSCVVKNADALALIQQLQAENADQAVRIQQIEKRVIHLEALDQSNLTTITMQERTRARLQERISQLEAERDAAVDDLEDYATLKCFACKYYETELTEAPCDECKIMEKGNRDKFEWRGVQKEE